MRKIATGLSALGVEPGHTVGLMLRNRPEFHLADTAILHLGAIPFSIYNTSAPDQIRYLFSNAENKIVITEKDFLPAIKAAGADLAQVIVVDADIDGCMTLEQLESLGAKTDFDFDSAWRAVRPDDVATLIYTSGTTGPPKGVELTHANLIAAFSAITDLLETQTGDRITSYLPHAHIADRVTGHYSNMVLGAQVTDVADPRAIAAALADVHPTTFLGVPRVWNKFKAGIETKLATEATGTKGRLARWAIDTGVRAARFTLAGKPVPPSLAVAPQHRRPPRAGKIAPSTRPGPSALGSNRCRAYSGRNHRIRLGAGHSDLRGVGIIGVRGRRDVRPSRRGSRPVRSGRRIPASRSRWPTTANCWYAGRS